MTLRQTRYGSALKMLTGIGHTKQKVIAEGATFSKGSAVLNGIKVSCS
ncbi:hypothetical protein GPS56_04835 [Acinetobacter haemolyticus]|nr:hypothetical protein [Acinetobacter haemolyticus]